MAFGLVEGAWLLRSLSHGIPQLDVTLDWQAFLADPRGLLLWEAFVTGSAKAADRTHSGDAAVACQEFLKRLPIPASDVTADRPLSLAGALLLWSGLSADPGVLAFEPLVVLPASA